MYPSRADFDRWIQLYRWSDLMPPYEPVKSKSQSRKLFALAREGKISLDDARGKTRAANCQSLPARKAKRGKRIPARRRPR